MVVIFSFFGSLAVCCNSEFSSHRSAVVDQSWIRENSENVILQSAPDYLASRSPLGEFYEIDDAWCCMWSFHHISCNDKSPFGSWNIHHSELFPTLFHSFRGDISVIPETDSTACHMICKIRVARRCATKNTENHCAQIWCVSQKEGNFKVHKKRVLVLRSPNCGMHPHVACLVQQGYIKENTCVKTGIHSVITWTSQNEHAFLNHPWTRPN